MITFNTKKKAGRGMGKEIGFPTINIELKSWPDGLSTGLYAVKVSDNWRFSKGLLNLSQSKTGEIRGEYHSMEGQHDMTDLSFTVIKKLRDYVSITNDNRSQIIEQDKELYRNLMNNIRTCDNCIFFVAEDYGYSNYTVEGTTYRCLKNRFLESEDNAMKYNAVNCDSFVTGRSWYLDVDGESDRPTEEWLKENGCSE